MNFRKIYRESNELEHIIAEKEHEYKGNLNRLASELRLSYMNYQDSLTMEPTIELCEMLKDEMKRIFKILTKFGINVQEYNKL